MNPPRSKLRKLTSDINGRRPYLCRYQMGDVVNLYPTLFFLIKWETSLFVLPFFLFN